MREGGRGYLIYISEKKLNYVKEGEGGDDPSKHLVLVWWGRIEVESRKMPRFLNKCKNVWWGFLREKKRRQGNGPTLFQPTFQPTNRHRTESKIRPDDTIYFFFTDFFLSFFLEICQHSAP